MKKEFDLTPLPEDKIVEELRNLRGSIEDLSAIIMGVIEGKMVNNLRERK